MKPDSCASYSSSQQSSYHNNSNGNSRIRVIKLMRRNNVPLGFSVRGGREHGTGIYVSEVRAGFEAHHQGLLVGDQILRINGFNIEYAIHNEVLALLRAEPGVVIKVKNMGMIPVKDTKRDPLTWKVVEPGPTSNSNGTNGCSSSVDDGLESRITIPSIGPSGLGCSIVKGPPDVPGIFVQSVKSGGLAEKAGLQIGDRITEMNGHNFNNVDFTDAVKILKSSEQMSLVLLKGIGLDLFPEEKLRRASQNRVSHEDKKKSSALHQAEDLTDERNAKKMNGHSPRVKNGSDPVRPGGESKGNDHSCSDTDMSLIQDDVSPSKHGHCVKVRATVHSSSGDDDSHSFVRKCTRESGDGMDYESLNGSRNQRRHNHVLWDEVKYSADCQTTIKPKDCSTKSQDSWEDESCSSQNSSRDCFKPNGCKSTGSTTNGHTDSITSDEKLELSSLSSDDYIPKISMLREVFESTIDDAEKPPSEFLKRKQHELLMEEFREVHKKMFGHGPPRSTKSQRQFHSPDLQDQSNMYKRRQQVRKDRVTPPPPPLTGMNDDTPTETAGVLECCILGEFDQKNGSSDGKVVFRRRQREPAITDSRDLNPKPPQIYFDRPESGPKPLVTIGTYANGIQPNRFLSNDVGLIKPRQNGTRNSNNFQETGVRYQHVKHSKGLPSANTVQPTLSEPKSSTRESLASCENLCNGVSIGKETSVPTSDEQKRVPNSFHASLYQFSKTGKKILEPGAKEQLLNKDAKGLNRPKSNLQNGNQKLDTNKQFLEKEADGREIKTLILKKNGPLNFTVEGGINSDLAGKVVVSDIWEGSCVTEGGILECGDQILMVDNTRISGLSLTAVNVALRNANSNSNKEMKLVIVKGQKSTVH